MPSDPRVAAALAALTQPIAEFRALVQGALAQADAYLSAQSADAAARTARAAVQLGEFGARHVTASRFAGLFPAVLPSDGRRCAGPRAVPSTVLRNGRRAASDPVRRRGAAGRRLGATIDEALAVAGHAFGAIIIGELVRGGRYRAAEHDRLLDATEFRAWNKAERRFAPPLVVEVDGADLHAGALLDFADGREKIVLVVRGAAPPAPPRCAASRRARSCCRPPTAPGWIAWRDTKGRRSPRSSPRAPRRSCTTRPRARNLGSG